MGLKESGLRGSLRSVSTGVSAIPDSVVDDFEDGDISEYSGDTAAWTVVQNNVEQGDFALQKDAPDSFGESIWSLPGDGLQNYPQANSDIAVLVREEGGVIPVFAFALEDDAGTIKGYGVQYEFNEEISLRRIDDLSEFSATTLDSDSTIDTNSGEWYYILIERESDLKEVTLFDLDDNPVSETISTTDTTYDTDEGIGFSNFTSISDTDQTVFDYVRADSVQ